MNKREYQERMSVLQNESDKIGEGWKNLIAEHKKIQEWLGENTPENRSVWWLFLYGLKLRFWIDPQINKIEKRQRKLTERQTAVKESLALLMSGETPTLH